MNSDIRVHPCESVADSAFPQGLGGEMGFGEAESRRHGAAPPALRDHDPLQPQPVVEQVAEGEGPSADRTRTVRDRALRQ